LSLRTTKAKDNITACNIILFAGGTQTKHADDAGKKKTSDIEEVCDKLENL